MTQIDSKIPEGQLAEKWSNYKAHQKLVNPANKRRLDIIVVGTGLAGASAAASLGEMGFRVFNRKRHSYKTIVLRNSKLYQFNSSFYKRLNLTRNRKQKQTTDIIRHNQFRIHRHTKMKLFF